MHTFAENPRVAQQAGPVRPAIANRSSPGQNQVASPALRQSRGIGNQPASGLLESDIGDLSRATITGALRHGHDFSRISIHSLAGAKIQTKLQINRAGDQYEQEADAVADQVLRMPEPGTTSPHAEVSGFLNQSESAWPIQRLSANRSPALEDAVVIEDGENLAEQPVQTLRPPGQTSGLTTIAKGLANSAQDGVPLGSTVRQFMEPRFGVDFSRVRIHANRRAAALSRSISARAFTHGRHVYFNEGEYQPDTHDGKRVLAHELTHVIQQGGSRSTQQPVAVPRAISAGTAGSAIIQRMGPLGAELRQNVAPWGSGPTGSDYEVSTDAGSNLSGWQAYAIFPTNLSYWCHGHSLGTFGSYGYSVYSGPPMQTVVKDEWNNVAPDKSKAGDMAVWTSGFDHSALFTKPVIEKGQLNHDKSTLSTKNGQAPLAVKTLTDIAGTYGSAGIAVFRHK